MQARHIQQLIRTAAALLLSTAVDADEITVDESRLEVPDAAARKIVEDAEPRDEVADAEPRLETSGGDTRKEVGDTAADERDEVGDVEERLGVD